MGKKVGIIGRGVVGSAVKNYFERINFYVIAYDKYKPEIDDPSRLAESDYIYVCVPTPFVEDIKAYDISAIEDSMVLLNEIGYGGCVIIKSTILPGTTRDLQKKHPTLKLLFNPEFLTEKTSLTDFIKPERQIVGFTEISKDFAQEVLGTLPTAKYSRTMPSDEAEMIKLFSNCFYAVKVIYANEMYDLCQAAGIDYSLVRNAAESDSMIGKNHLDVLHGGYRGYGGKCLPKDLKATLNFSRKLNAELSILDLTDRLNNSLTSG